MLSLGHLTHYWHHQWHTSNICTKRLRSDQTGGDPQFGSFRSPFPPSSTRQLQQQSSYHKSQGDFNCGSSSQAGFILNYFLLNFLSHSAFPPSLAGRLKQLKPPWVYHYHLLWSTILILLIISISTFLERHAWLQMTFGHFYGKDLQW